MTQSLVFSGSSGEYATTADINLLDADTAHCVQSSGAWIQWAGNASYARTSRVVGSFGGSVKGTEVGGSSTNLGPSSGAVAGANPKPGAVPVTAGETISVSLSVLSDTPNRQVQFLRFFFRDNAGATIENRDTNLDVPLSPGVATTVTATEVVPAGATYVFIAAPVEATGGGNLPIGEEAWWGTACIRTGTDAGFVPSLRIVGDLDIESDLSRDWTPAGNEYTATLFGKFDWFVNATGLLAFAYYDETDTQRFRSSTIAIPATGSERGIIRTTLAFGANETKHYWNGQVFDTRDVVGSSLGGTPTQGALQVAAQQPAVGNAAGTFYSYTMRDGIDGPIVAQFEADDIQGSNGPVAPYNPWTDTTQRAWQALGYPTLAGVPVEPPDADAPFVTFPGTAGNYASRADTNLLDADTAHFVQGTGSWSTGLTVQTDADAVFGPSVGRREVNNTNGEWVYASSDRAPIGTGEHTASLWHRVTEADRESRMDLFVYDAANGGSIVQQIPGVFVDDAAPGTWKQFTITGTVNTAGFAQLGLFTQAKTGSMNAAEPHFFDAVCLRTGSDASFVPSVRVVGDLDLRWDGSIATIAQIPYMFDRSISAPNNSYRIYKPSNSNGQIRLDISSDGGPTTNSYTSSNDFLIAGERHTHRVTRTTAGQAEFFRDGVSQASPSDGGGAIYGAAASDFIAYGRVNGPNVEGDLHLAEVRDGIDGPIVAVFDPKDAQP